MRKKNLKVVYITAMIILIVVGYLFSYCLILPIFEKVGLGSLGYLLYEPVEIIRNFTNKFWIITEGGYNYFGGKQLSTNRYFFKVRRKFIQLYRNGIPKIEINVQDKKLDGPYKLWSRDGQLLMYGEYKDGCPFSGFLYLTSEGNSNEECPIGEYKDGKLVKQYSLKEQMVLMEEGFFAEPLKKSGGRYENTDFSGDEEHEVTEGETFEAIAELYDIDLDKLKKANKNIKELKDGMRLVIPCEKSWTFRGSD